MNASLWKVLCRDGNRTVCVSVCVCQCVCVCVCVREREYLSKVPVKRNDVVITSFVDYSVFIQHILIYLLHILHIHPVIYGDMI